MKKLLSYLLGGAFAVLLGFGGLLGNSVQAAADCGGSCEDGIKLNTCFPIIGDCIKTGAGKTNATQAFPTMIGALTKIIMALVLIVCFIFVIIAGIKRASDDPKTARSIIIKVGITVLLLGFSGVILRLINPNFFGGWFI